MSAGPEQGARAVLGSVLSVAATWAALLALTGLVAGRRWFLVACVAVLVVATAAALTRAVTRAWWAPTVVGTLVALVGLVLRYGAPPGRPQFLPDLDAVRRAWATWQQGAAVVAESYVPMPDVRAGEMLLVTGALAVLLLVDAAVLALRVPAVAGLPLVALWVPAVVLGFPAGAAPVFWSAVAYLAILAYGAAPLHAHAGRLRRACTSAVAALTLASIGLVAGPPLMDAPGWASVSLPTFGDAPVGPLELSDDLDLRDSLGSRSAQVVLRYTVVDPTAPDDAPPDEAAQDEPSQDEATADDAAAAVGSTTTPSLPATPAVDARLVGPLRAFTLATFDGRLWERAESDTLDAWDAALLLASDPALRGTSPDARAGALAQVEVVVDSLRERRLPVSTLPRTVEIGGGWGYDERRDEVVGDSPTREGLRYSMLVQVPELTADDLRGAVAGVPQDAALYTAVPHTDHRDDVARVAAEVTADAAGPYEQALALQTWLRSAANFTYDTRVPPARSQDAVWDFLQDRRGYCVHFATAMTMMARSLDIPARVGVGFLPGERDGDGTYVVTGRLAHAWPELYFDGLGWVRFEPTPATQSGPPPRWADPFTGISAPGSVPDEELIGGLPGQVPTDPATAPAQVPGTATDDAARTSWLAVVLAVAAVVVAAGTALTLLLVRRRRRTATSPEHAWATLRRELARSDVRWSDATSPRGALRDVQRTLTARGGRALDGAALTAFEHLVRAVEQERYAPAPDAVDADDLDAWVQAVRGGVTDALVAAPARTPEPVG